jgi:glycerol 3-phosphatase-2
MSGLSGSGGLALRASHDVLLLDLDGVVYSGGRAVRGAVPALAQAVEQGLRLCFVTNNASRPAEQVAAQLVGLGLPARASDVVTSADAAADALAAMLPAGSAVLVVGGVGLTDAVRSRGLQPVSSATDDPVAVVQGFGPDVGWRLLAEAAYTLVRGVPWVASNRDLTFPTERGLAPGNGTFVQALELTTGRTPVTVGKPEPTLFVTAVQHGGARRPLVVGDRLDTDILGANRAGLASLLVLTGVTTVADLLVAGPDERPGHVAVDLDGLHAVHPAVDLEPAATDVEVAVGGWRARPVGGALELTGDGEPVDALRCATVAAWSLADRGAEVRHDAVTALLAERLDTRR